MSKEKCKHEEWNPCGNNFYSCRQCGILRTSQQVNIYAEKDKQISELEKQLADAEHEIENYKHELEVYKHNDNIYSSNIIKMNNNAKRNKIDFAVNQLEKVKEICSKQYMFDGYIPQATLKKHIDNQIKQLKEK